MIDSVTNDTAAGSDLVRRDHVAEEFDYLLGILLGAPSCHGFRISHKLCYRKGVGTFRLGFQLRHFDKVIDNKADDLIADLVPRGSLVTLVGNSGIGKTALAYQIAYCVAGGWPFLDRGVRQGSVYYIDQENGAQQVAALRDSFHRFFGIAEDPEDFRIYNPILVGRTANFKGEMSLDQQVAAIRACPPSAVFLDTIFSNDTRILTEPERCNEFLNQIRPIAREHGTTFFLLTHPKKHQEKAFSFGGRPSLFDESSFMDWFANCYGTTALLTGTDVRLGFDRVPGEDVAADKGIAGYSRVQGAIRPIYLETVLDDEVGDPMGFKRVDTDLASLPDGVLSMLRELPAEFTHADFVKVFKGSRASAYRALRLTLSTGVVLRLPRRLGYRKVNRDI